MDALTDCYAYKRKTSQATEIKKILNIESVKNFCKALVEYQGRERNIELINFIKLYG